MCEGCAVLVRGRSPLAGGGGSLGAAACAGLSDAGLAASSTRLLKALTVTSTVLKLPPLLLSPAVVLLCCFVMFVKTLASGTDSRATVSSNTHICT